MKVKENRTYCATFPTNGGSVTAVFSDGTTMVLASMNGAGQATVFAISDEIILTDGVRLDPFSDAAPAALGGGGEQITIDDVPNKQLERKQNNAVHH